MAIDAVTPRSRRSLLASLVGGVAAAGAATLAGAQRVLGAGDDGTPIAVGGAYTDARTVTNLINNANDKTALRVGNNQAGTGIEAFAYTGTAMQALTSKGTAVYGSGDDYIGVAARSLRGTGLWATHGSDAGQSPGYPAAIMAESNDENGPAIIGNNYATTGSAHGVQGLSDSPEGWATLG